MKKTSDLGLEKLSLIKCSAEFLRRESLATMAQLPCTHKTLNWDEYSWETQYRHKKHYVWAEQCPFSQS